MQLGQLVLVVYAILMLAGGIAGYRIAGSTASLAAGAGSAAALAGAWLLSRTQPATGFWVGAGVAAALALFFLYRVVKTGKPMPAGGLLALSVLAVALLVWAALHAGKD